jgi:YD repeat-containing protein
LGNGLQVTTLTAPDGSQSVTTNLNGQVISVTRLDATGSQISQTIYGYDAFGRLAATTDARTGTTTSTFIGTNRSDR